MVIDYKSSTNGKIYPEYQQQIEFYAWILRKRNYRFLRPDIFLCTDPT